MKINHEDTSDLGWRNKTLYTASMIYNDVIVRKDILIACVN